MTQVSARDTPQQTGSAPDRLDHRRRVRRSALWIGGLGVLLLISIPVAVGLGPVSVPPGTVAQIIVGHVFGSGAGSGLPADDIIWLVRVPRVLLAVVVGAALAISGVALQALVRNVLAEPYLLGVSAGASTGAALSILFGIGVSTGATSLTGSAFIGALLATAVVFLLAGSGGQITSVRLLLSGVAVGYVLNAATSFLIFASDTPEGARAVLFWLLGSLTRAEWSAVAIAGLLVAGAFVTLLLWARNLDALTLGDDTAHALGSPPARVRAQTLVVVAVCVGAVVAVSGGIGFVGLVVPHVARLCVGGVHRRLLPVAALIGATFLVWADVIARMAFVPRELPLGIVTAVVGAPFLLFLVRRLRSAA
ncbi:MULTISPECIES: FecCD family ABC transporter permease [Actinoalloteichus]|uniref:ABC-type Fe3+-siderophore transport system, permease component n=1 Tax=Actinoalloteichus fjordicus TaxID=1612552 RepID=A0AAC9LHJ0_9PSEU|nr:MULTISPECIES: iron ABC transporter permease [Actinoalloteichus]APU16465.1 ABC-type Fe3+-siderophore transport system, permease component [Actinoalloteichus fjordicus]APU22524.1 ABC-type Fe3+-siderophore transport system, permease component [Actinoalloteichus sp. GBA129-24]